MLRPRPRNVNGIFVQPLGSPAPEAGGSIYLGGVIGIAFVVGLLVWALKRMNRPADPAPATA